MYEDQFNDSAGREPERPFFAEVNNTATADGQDIFVVIPGIDADRKWGPVHWTPRPGASGPTFPYKGVPALVTFDDDHNLWMIAWWPYV
jgi:hypothetical protein